jgi:spore coat protein A, manganese oxidase
MRKKLSIRAGLAATGFLLLAGGHPQPALAEPLPGGTLSPSDIPKYAAPLIIPPVMPSSTSDRSVDYQIAVREFRQQILPAGLPATTVWSYGSVDHPGTVADGGSFNYPAFTIEAKWSVPTRVRWINGLVDESGNYLDHLLAVDRTLHWANPELLPCMDGTTHTDCRPDEANGPFLQVPYDGPVPIVTHVHGAETFQDSDGYPEAWYLPNATNIPAGYATTGTLYSEFKFSSPLGGKWEPGTAVFRYPNHQRAATLWYHDHTLGITRLNVYAGPAGFYLLRGGTDGDRFTDNTATRRAKDGMLPGPAPGPGEDVNGLTAGSVREKIREIPIAIQDRSFNSDGSLFYPGTRTFFDDFEGPFTPDQVDALGTSDVSPIWNPEFFGNTMVVNGRSWPVLEVAQALYRFRLLNGSNSRFLILTTDDDADNADGVSPQVTFWQIGADGGFLPAPVMLDNLILAPAERADVLVDFSGLPDGTEIYLLNLGPDEPFGGGAPGTDFPLADAGTTGQVMKFVVNAALTGKSPTDPNGATPATAPGNLALPQRVELGQESRTQFLSLNEEMSAFAEAIPEFDLPIAALLGTVNPATGIPTALAWMDAITEEPEVGATEIWEMWNFTVDAHPIHIHQVQFEVVGREVIGGGTSVAGSNEPLPWETGTKDTVIAYPGEITRVKARFRLPGLFVWHCHILEHEDNEMMRPYCVANPDGSRPEACDVADGNLLPAMD